MPKVTVLEGKTGKPQRMDLWCLQYASKMALLADNSNSRK